MFAKVPEGVQISLYIQPNASKTEIIGEHNGSLKIKIKAPPVEGKANDEVVAFLSKVLGISKRNIDILKGDKSREKKVLIRGVALPEIQKALLTEP